MAIVEIVPFSEKHIEDAAALVAGRYTNLRSMVPTMPDYYENPAAFQPLLQDLTQQNPGVAALNGGQLIGFAAGMVLPDFRGRRSVYSPEWANAAVEDQSREVYQQLYAALSEVWVADRCSAHYVTVFAHDRPGIEAWSWQGFGMSGVDAMRDLSPASSEPVRAHIETKPVTPDDIDALLQLEGNLITYMEAAPIFLLGGDTWDGNAWAEYLKGEQNRVWLAYCDGELSAYMKMGPPNPGACHVIKDPATVSITGAFTQEPHRAQGVATVLLNEVLDWARDHGYTRCGVDFEPMNILGARFWLRHFQAFCFSMHRMIDGRLMPPAQ